MISQVTTSGTFATEPEAWARFDELVNANRAFKMHREVAGEYIQPRLNTEDKTARVDRILIPLKPAIEAGWRHGAIAIEGKKSGHDLGPFLTQALDYSRCVWRLTEGVPGLQIVTTWVFLYPLERTFGDTESVMANNRIGWCMARRRMLVFGCSATNGLILHDDERVEVKPLLMGRKRGSR